MLCLQTTAQHNQEDAAIAAQVRKEMWGNLQNILAMLANQGCSPHVHDMVHQIAVHFANEQSQAVALERRMTCVLSREKEAQKQLQQQLRGALQVWYIPAWFLGFGFSACLPSCFGMFVGAVCMIYVDAQETWLSAPPFVNQLLCFFSHIRVSMQGFTCCSHGVQHL